MRDMGMEMTPIASQEPSRTGTPELLMKTRREIMAFGTKLGKTNIATVAIKDGEDRNVSSLLKTDKALQPNTTVTETRAAAWEDAEEGKYLSRFKREEIKIEA